MKIFDEYQVIIGSNVYKVPSDLFIEMLNKAKKHYKNQNVIICVEKHKIAMFKKDKFDTKDQMKKDIEKYLKEGYKVHYNKGRNNG